MSVWEKVFKNQGSKIVASLGAVSVKVPDVVLPKRSYQLPSLFLGLALGTTYTKRTFLYQMGTEVVRWNPEHKNEKLDFSVFRVEKVLSDTEMEISHGEEAFTNFMSDRSDPPCTLFFQPIRFLISGNKIPSFVTTGEGQKILYQSPSNKEIYQHYLRVQFRYLWNKAHSMSADRRFAIGHVVVEIPDYFATPDVKRYREWLVDTAKGFFPPSLPTDEEVVDYTEKFTLLPESLVSFLHWLTDHVEPKLATQDLELKKLLVRYGILPKVGDPIHFLIVTMGSTHSRVVRLRIPSIEQVASAKKVGENVSVAHTYLGRTGFGGDHISTTFLAEEEERRYGTTPVHRVSTLSRKVLEDWSKINQPDGKKHFDELLGEQFAKAIDKLGELTIKGFSENPENTVVILGGKVFEIPYLRDKFKDYLQHNRIPLARVTWPSAGEIGIERVCEILQFHQKGLGRLFNIKSGLESEGAQRFTWKVGKVVEGNLVDSLLEPDNKKWDAENPREFTVEFGRGVRRLNLGYQQAAGGISQLWVNVTLKSRVVAPVQVTFRSDGPDDLKIAAIKTDDKTVVTAEDFQIEMLIAGEHPSYFPLCDKLLGQ